ncbi:MAG: UDP-N-acetylglucosamine 2-epimerase [Thaumarchaeota archaeon 13_1_20CM_2_39_20]|nr:MAG: UDP-N-acetylglucosamine 2-epimerase [Thaumarchaeota archaeon 13_1_40CM_3_38_6]OLD22800.1 MAG: UDP-N-acetylglucosamine 2-epimerase [Thaumarchaeota archaeon 13_1_40CM_2_39_13_1]OLE41205.1 MAG: UDP-N-acetylglucosamine 2-epimerase [Thaumarchaeota archaeon 13_1_20CM_2_39_20]
MKTAIVMGTRPEIIKLAPIIHQLNKNNAFVIFTGQHYDYNMSLQFIEELDIRKPDYWMEITKANPSIQVGEIIIKLTKILQKLKPDTVLVEGDTNTVLAASVASLKSGVPVSHVEAGPRSFDWRMPEEHNRIEVDHIAELLFAPSQYAKKNLLSERVHGKIFVTGNTVIDAIQMYADLASKKSHFSGDMDDFILMTLHRGENVDNKEALSGIVRAILNSNQKIIFPVHPRTVGKLHRFGLYKMLRDSENVHLTKPVGYFDMLELMKKCLFIITDSGGIQQEATSPKIRKRVLVTRKTTDSPEAVMAGVAEVVGVEEKKILSAIKRTQKNPRVRTRSIPFGNGNAAKRIIKILKEHF